MKGFFWSVSHLNAKYCPDAKINATIDTFLISTIVAEEEQRRTSRTKEEKEEESNQ